MTPLSNGSSALPARLPLQPIAYTLLAGACFLMLVFGIKGCTDDNSSGLSYSSFEELPAPTFGTATVSGRVAFEGNVSKPRLLHSPTSACPHGVYDESLIVGEDGGLANAVVYLEGVAPSSGVDRPTVKLDQINCQFVPHVMAVQVGQPVDIGNSDPTTHNVHYTPRNNADVNHDFSGGSQNKHETVRFARAEPEPFKARCDVHDWMSAYIGVFDHPFFAVTDASGAFELDRVPAGDYTLTAWHERHGERKTEIKVGEDDVSHNFVYRRSS